MISFGHARRAIALIATFGAMVAVLSASPYMEALEQRVTLPFLFFLRHEAKREPVLDPRIKIIGYGDSSVMRLKRPSDVPTRDWLQLIEALAAKEPAAIFIDF